MIKRPVPWRGELSDRIADGLFDGRATDKSLIRIVVVERFDEEESTVRDALKKEPRVKISHQQSVAMTILVDLAIQGNPERLPCMARLLDGLAKSKLSPFMLYYLVQTAQIVKRHADTKVITADVVQVIAKALGQRQTGPFESLVKNRCSSTARRDTATRTPREFA